MSFRSYFVAVSLGLCCCFDTAKAAIVSPNLPIPQYAEDSLEALRANPKEAKVIWMKNRDKDESMPVLFIGNTPIGILIPPDSIRENWRVLTKEDL